MRRAIIAGIALGATLGLAACGGGGPREPARTAAVPHASGPISRACMASGREGRSARLCGCVQAAADLSLTSAQQRRAVGFYANPHQAQEIRQSKRPADEQFWKAYSEYGQRAERMCG